MFCIAAFIILAILGIFSASHRKLAKKAWGCVVRRLTFKPCDINFSEEMKGKILGKLVFTRPKLAKFLERWFDWLAFAFVALSVWSLVAAFNAGLNLWVYDTCDPVTGESCSLSGEACGVGREQLGFIEAIQQNRLGEWVSTPFVTFAETVTRIPDRMKTWNAEEYLGPTGTFYYPEDKNKPYALEAIDPGCQYCKKLFENIQKAGFEERYNLSYLVYPIPDLSTASGYKFANSLLIARYLEAVKKVPLATQKFQNTSEAESSAEKKLKVAPDWQLLEKIFTGQDADGLEWQQKFNMLFTADEAEQQLQSFLAEIGYSQEDIEKISTLSRSNEVNQSLQEQKKIVEQKIKTIRIPTIIFGGRRFDRVVAAEQLQ